MRKCKVFISFLLSLFVLFFSCNGKNNDDAKRYVHHIDSLYRGEAYTEALQKIDSIQVLFPKAIDEIKEGMELKQKVRLADCQEQITISDSLLLIYGQKIDSMKPLFSYKKEKNDDLGIFTPRATAGALLTANMLRASVDDEGTLYIESIYLGTQLHNQIQVSAKGKGTAQSLPVDDDGLNFRFNNLGKQYEIIRVDPMSDNGLAKFIQENQASAFTVTLKGKNTYSYILLNNQKKAIIDTHNLSALMLTKDSLMEVKDKAEIKLKYLLGKESKSSNTSTTED